MSPTSRRIFLYWLLLLVPTLVVGGGAILLLRREQQRIERQGAYADEASRAAVATRARLVVETVELIVGDVQTGLLDVLAAEPVAGVDDFLAQWEKGNPLVQTAFRASADGRVLRPELRTSGEEGRGFLRRFSGIWNVRPPWGSASTAAPAPVLTVKPEPDRADDAAPARQEVSKNVFQAQSARRDVQELLKNSSSFANNSIASADARVSGAAAGLAAAAQPEAERSSAKPAAAPSSAAFRSQADRERKAESAGFLSSRSAGALRPESRAAVSAAPSIGANARAKDAPSDRRGWEPLMVDGKLHLVGWVQPGGAGEVRGVELNLAALIAKFAGALPAELAEGEGYALRDDQGRVLHQSGAVPRGATPAVGVPLASTLLPGWDVAGFLANGTEKFSVGVGFFGVGALLVAIFVAAILAGGSLLVRQARRSYEEAAQKTSFVANVSHEFKTPLTTIRLYSELLEQGRVRDQAQGGEYLRTIGRETQRLARLVNNALDFSRLEQGRKKYAREPVDLTTELARLLDTHAPRVADAGLALRRELPAEPVRLTTDRDAVEQIVLNLLDNACKYASDGGEVSVLLAARQGGGAEIRVADRGPGVPPEHRERIFEKFHRVDDTLTAEKTGAGLGLSIARQLARGLGGELRYEARRGAGAEFVLSLP